MLRKLAAVVCLLGALLVNSSAQAQGCGPSNPNCVVPTVPSCVSDNRAASTAYVTNCATGGGGGGTGLNITRAAIPSTNTNSAPSLTLTGFLTNQDPGSGSPYTCLNQTATSIGAIQDSTGTWCAFDLARVAMLGGFRPGWFGAVGNNSTDDATAFQAWVDAGWNSKLNNWFCPASPSGNGYLTGVPIYFDQPNSFRGGQRWTSQVFGNGFPPGSIVSQDGLGAGISANNSSSNAYGYPPSSPDYSGFGFDVAFFIASNANPVTYHPTYTTSSGNGLFIVPFKASGSLSAPAVIAKAANISANQNVALPTTVTVSAPIGSTVVVAINDWGGVAGGPTTWVVTDSAGNTYTRHAGIDNATLGGTIEFDSVNIATALTGGVSTISILNNSVNWSGAMEALSIANATAGVDTAAIASVDNTGSPTNTPTVTSGTLATTNEMVLGFFVGINNTTGKGFTESAGFTTTSPSLWSPGAWNIATTYNAGDHVIFRGIPWSSLAGGNVGNQPDASLGANSALTFWQPVTVGPVTGTALSNPVSFRGPAYFGPGNFNAGCMIRPSFNNSAGIVNTPGNGVNLENIAVVGPTGATRCGQPTTGVGIAEFGLGGGSNRTKYSNVTVQNFYYGTTFGSASIQALNVAGPGLGAENHLYSPYWSNTCFMFANFNTQGFINSIYSATATDNGTAIYSPFSTGVVIEGGNWSHENGPFALAKFTLSSVVANAETTGVGYSFTANIATPSDPYMTKNCTETINSTNLPTFFPTRRCEINVYTLFLLDLRNSGYGILPVIMTSFTRGSPNTATFWTEYSWYSAGGGRLGSAVQTAIGAQTSIWGAEVTRLFIGSDISVNDVHVETVAPFQLANSFNGFGNGGPISLRHIFFNSDFTNCNAYTPGVASTEAACFAQQEVPWLDLAGGTGSSAGITGTDIIIEDAISLGVAGTSGEVNMVNFPLNPLPGGGGHLKIRNFLNGQFNFRVPAGTANNPSGAGSNANISGGYGGYGSVAFGQGDFDILPMTGTSQTGAGNDGSADAPTGFGGSDIAWLTRSQGLNSGPFYGTRPAPWTTPCLSPLQYAKLTNFLPPIWLDANNFWVVNYPLLWSGQQYKICDWDLSPSPAAWNSGTNYYPGSKVSSGGNIYVSLAGDTKQVANSNQTPGSPQAFTASISSTPCAGVSGGCMTVTAITGGGGRLPIHGVISSGAAAGTIIVNQQTGSAGQIGTYEVQPPQTVASGAMAETVWASLGATLHYGAISSHFAGYSYGQNITTTNDPGLSWTISNNGPMVQVTGGRLGLFFPGVVAGFAGTQVGCTTQENFAIRGVHYVLKFMDLFNLDSDVNGAIVPAFGAALCSNTVINQAPYSVTTLN